MSNLAWILPAPFLLAFVYGCGAPEPTPQSSGSTGSGGSATGAGGSATGAGGSATGAGGSATGAGGSTGAGGTTGAGGSTGGSGGSAGASGGSAGNGGSAGSGGGTSEPFSFFVTSLNAMLALAQAHNGSEDGFGGDLTYGETGPGAGLRGADKICTEIAETSMPGNGKTWRAFLSAHDGGDGNPVNAIDRIGEGPWYDRLGRILANNKAELQNTRPSGAHADIIDDLPNEEGVPNHNPDGAGEVDNHQFLTGSNEMGELYSQNTGSTCNSWTSSVGSSGKPRAGHSWPRSSTPWMGMNFPEGGPGDEWISAFDAAGCAPGVTLVELGPAPQGDETVGGAGGYGGIYCFALTP